LAGLSSLNPTHGIGQEKLRRYQIEVRRQLTVPSQKIIKGVTSGQRLQTPLEILKDQLSFREAATFQFRRHVVGRAAHRRQANQARNNYWAQPGNSHRVIS
jgi:hypothetical protein